MKYASHWRYISKVRLTLLGAGEQGMPAYDLNQKTRTKHFNQDNLNECLDEWEGRDWVQIFNILDPTTKRKKKIVRATTLLRDQWSGLKIDGKLTTEADLEIDASQH